MQDIHFVRGHIMQNGLDAFLYYYGRHLTSAAPPGLRYTCRFKDVWVRPESTSELNVKIFATSMHFRSFLYIKYSDVKNNSTAQDSVTEREQYG